MRRANDTRTHPVTGVPFSSRSLMECYDAGAATFGWAERDPAVGAMRDGDWLVGYGCATATYPTLVAPSSASVRMQASGHALVELSAHDVGTGAYTVMAQIAAARLGLPVEAIEVNMGHSSLPLAIPSGGSVTTASAGSAVHLACQKVGERVVELLAAKDGNPFSGVDPATVTLEDGTLSAPSGASMPLLDALKETAFGEASALADYTHPTMRPRRSR